MPELSETTGAGDVTRPTAIMDSTVAAAAFEAFNAMQTTKQRHYALLQRLDDKRTRFGLSPTEQEARLLDALLSDHDAQVKRFTNASKALKDESSEAHMALFQYIGALESALAPVTH